MRHIGNLEVRKLVSDVIIKSASPSHRCVSVQSGSQPPPHQYHQIQKAAGVNTKYRPRQNHNQTEKCGRLKSAVGKNHVSYIYGRSKSPTSIDIFHCK